MIRDLLFFSVILITLSCARSQSVTEQQTGNPLFLHEQNLNGGTLITEKTYDGSSLWGYINGGADLYLEYGFRKLFLQEISKDQKAYKIEIYQMIDPESAFGIFSVSRFKCKSDSSIPALNCVMPYQIQLVIGSCYISIINQKASADEQEYTRFLCDQIVQLIKPEPFDYPELFRDSIYAGHLGRLMLMKGPIGLMNGFPDWSDRFEKFTDYTIVLLPIQTASKEFNLALIDFKTNEARTNYLVLNNIDGITDKNITALNHTQTEGIALSGSRSLIIYQTNMTEKESLPYIETITKAITFYK